MATLFDHESQYREKAAIWRILSSLPLHSSLSKGHVWRWWAVGIPMDLGTGGTFTSDLDIIACLREFPPSKRYFYRTWEVKVSLLHKNGTESSLKVGKTSRTIDQLRAYRNFGAPQSSLLDVYICEDGYMENNSRPSQRLCEAVTRRHEELKRHCFGYSLLPIEYTRENGNDANLRAFTSQHYPFSVTYDFLPSLYLPAADGFLQLVRRLDYFSTAREHRRYGEQIVFCRNCRQLQIIRMKEEHNCPLCNDDLIRQS